MYPDYIDIGLEEYIENLAKNIIKKHNCEVINCTCFPPGPDMYEYRMLYVKIKIKEEVYLLYLLINEQTPIEIELQDLAINYNVDFGIDVVVE